MNGTQRCHSPVVEVVFQVCLVGEVVRAVAYAAILIGGEAGDEHGLFMDGVGGAYGLLVAGLLGRSRFPRLAMGTLLGEYGRRKEFTVWDAENNGISFQFRKR